jgi:hypothetical protein
MDLFTSLLVKAIGGIFYVAYWLAWQLLRALWWLSVFLLLSLGAGVAWLARGGRAKEADTGGFGRPVQGSAFWQDDASGTVYPVTITDLEQCEIRAELTGQYWRRTAIAGLARRGAIAKYKFSAVGVSARDGRESVAAWCEFQQEARKNITLDHLAPESVGVPEPAGVPPFVMTANRDAAFEAYEHVKWLLSQRGWKLVDHSGNPASTHWYAARYSRAISWDAPVATEIPADQSSDQLAGGEA